MYVIKGYSIKEALQINKKQVNSLKGRGGVTTNRELT